LHTRRLHVSLGGAQVGHLELDRWAGQTFTPAPTWLEGGQCPRLGAVFLRRPGRLASTHVPLWFENLLPEKGSPLRRVLATVHGLREGQSFDLLRVLGRDLPGAVRVDSEDASSLDQGPPAPTMRFSLAGMQLKFSVHERDGGLALPTDGTAGDWIVKLAGGLDELPAVEFATMAWAEAMGLPVPECKRVRLADVEGLGAFAATGDECGFAIRRYDRPGGGARVHQEDFAQVFHVDPVHKYGESGPRKASLDDVGRVVAAACGKHELLAFLDRIAFVVASGNGDAHLKNWALVYQDGENPALAPCYDQVCTVAWPERHGWAASRRPRLALALGKARAFDHLGRPCLAAFAASVGLPASHVEERFLATLERARAAWPSVAADAPTCMREALAEHWARVPLLDALGGLRVRYR
jgi:serine/threonine-protein kinase HipA